MNAIVILAAMSVGQFAGAASIGQVQMPDGSIQMVVRDRNMNVVTGGPGIPPGTTIKLPAPLPSPNAVKVKGAAKTSAVVAKKPEVNNKKKRGRKPPAWLLMAQ